MNVMMVTKFLIVPMTLGKTRDDTSRMERSGDDSFSLRAMFEVVITEKAGAEGSGAT